MCFGMTHSCAWRVTYSYVWHESFRCDVSPPKVWHLRQQQHMQAQWNLIHIYDSRLSTVWNESLIRVTWVIIRDMIYSHVRHICSNSGTRKRSAISFVCVTWIIHACHMTHFLCDVTNWYVRHLVLQRHVQVQRHLKDQLAAELKRAGVCVWERVCVRVCVCVRVHQLPNTQKCVLNWQALAVEPHR